MALKSPADIRKLSFEELTVEELIQILEKIENSCDTLNVEIQMFENTLCRIGGETRDYLYKPESLPSIGKRKVESTAVHRKSRVYKFTDERFLGLDAAQKCEIANKEIDELTEASRKFITECENTTGGYQATIMEADLCLQAIRKDIADFETVIVNAAINPFTHATKAEKCIRYFENKLKNLDSLKKKLKLKYCSVKTQEKKLLLQIEQKEQIGDVLHVVDFDQMKIINQQYKQTLSERSRDLLQLKLMAGNVQKALNSHKRMLQDLNKESNRIRNDITARVDFMKRVDVEANSVQTEIFHIEKSNDAIRTTMTNYHAPTIMEYVLANAEVLSLQSELKTWQRRVKMTEMALDNYNKTSKRLNRMKLIEH